MNRDDLQAKWGHRVPSGWYGFAQPDAWSDIVDLALTAMVRIEPDLEIHQVKEKFGGLRLYTGSPRPYEDRVADGTFAAIAAVEKLAEASVLR